MRDLNERGYCGCLWCNDIDFSIYSQQRCVRKLSDSRCYVDRSFLLSCSIRQKKSRKIFVRWTLQEVSSIEKKIISMNWERERTSRKLTWVREAQGPNDGGRLLLACAPQPLVIFLLNQCGDVLLVAQSPMKKLFRHFRCQSFPLTVVTWRESYRSLKKKCQLIRKISKFQKQIMGLSAPIKRRRLKSPN